MAGKETTLFVVKYKHSQVNSSGKITAKAKGTCYVYLITQNGLNVKMKITVK